MYSATNTDHDIAVIGSGFSGLGAAIRLRQEGREDFVVLERAETLGGTWRDNTYPGCGCDVPTPLYSFSFAPNPEWSHFYAKQDEIRAYMEQCADRFGVRPHLRFGAEVVGGEWEEDAQRWRLRLAGGEELTARVVIGGVGGLTRPSYPDIEGLENFDGPLIHSAAWDHTVTLEGKRVAVIGTGASSIQLVPEIAKIAERVEVFQRTAPWVFPKIDMEFGPRMKALFRRVPLTQRLLREAVFWFAEAIAYPLTRRPALTKILELVARAHLRRQVRDPELRAKLTPDYKPGCKRMLPSNDYLRSLGRENVELVTEPIARVSAGKVVTADGGEHAADVLVCSTGFDITGHVTEVDFRGRGGASIGEVWRRDGISAHRGTMVAGFPNLMLLSGPNTGTGSTSQIYMIEAQIGYALRALAAIDDAGAAVVEARADAQARYNERLQARMKDTVWLSGCGSWYLDDQGTNRVLYPGFSSQFARSMKNFRSEEHILEPARERQPGSDPLISPV